MMDEISYGRRLTQLAAQRRDATAIHFATTDGGERPISWSELEQRSNQVARLLEARGVGQDDTVAVGLINSPAHVYATFGAWKLGASVLPMRWDLPAWERERLLEVAGATAVVADWADASPGTLTHAELAESVSLSADALPDRIPSRARLVASSGSTGRPKIIVAPQPGVVRVGDTAQSSTADEQPAIYLCNSPLYHVNGSAYCFLQLLAGNRVVLMERFDAARAVELIERYRAQYATMVPTMLMRIARLPGVETRDLSSLERIVYGGASIPEWVVRTWFQLIPPERFFFTYGGSEGIGLCMTSGDRWLEHPGTCGQPVDCEVKILSADGTERPAGEIGEIHMRRQDTGETFHYLGQPTPDATVEGFRSFGDMGYVDPDGFVYVVDRRHDMIVSGGANVFPAEVEAALSEHVGVTEVVVVGLPDDEWGHRVHAIVRPADPAGPPTIEDLRGHCKTRLAAYKVPKSFELVDELPYTAAGKINRTALAKQRAGSHTGHG